MFLHTPTGLAQNVRSINFQSVRDAQQRIEVRCAHPALDVADDLIGEARALREPRKRKIALGAFLLEDGGNTCANGRASFVRTHCSTLRIVELDADVTFVMV